jgi:orotate phosphoribosyltransferase
MLTADARPPKERSSATVSFISNDSEIKLGYGVIRKSLAEEEVEFIEFVEFFELMDILERFRETNALLEGHFILSSGLHSPKYLQCALALQHPVDAAMYGDAIAGNFTGDVIETVASPAIGGLVIGFTTAQALGVRFIWTERENGVMTLRRGFSVKEGERILVVEDVITTGGSTRECIAALENQGAAVVAAASIIDRSNGTADVGVPRVELVRLDVPSYSPDDCPLCAAGIEAIKPGSRTSK